MCIVTIKFIKLSEFIVESQYFIPLLNKISWFVNNIQEGMKHQMGGATQAQQGMTF
jgi:hypothetical protein